MYHYRQIISQLRMGSSIRTIAKTKLADRKKLRTIKIIAEAQGWLKLENPIPDDEALAQFFKKIPCTQTSLLAPHQNKIETWVGQGVQASTIHAHLLREHGVNCSYSTIQRFIKEVKGQVGSATTILEFSPGETAQVDFGFGPKLIDETTGAEVKTWIFVMVLSWSRHMYAEIVLRQDVETWLGCHRRAFEWFNGVPSKIIIDNAKCAITKACYHDPVVQRSYAEFAQGYGFIVSPCPPYDPQKKGRVESGVKYVKNRFVPLRTFRSLADANQQLKQFVMEEAGQRIHGSTRQKPLALFEIEQPTLKRLPEHAPELAVWTKVILHGDCHVQHLKCRYSASHRFVKQELWLRATDTTVRLYLNHEMISVHPRLWIAGTKSTITEHLPPQAIFYQMKDTRWCLKQATEIGPFCTQVIQELLNDSVVDYLRAAQGILGLQKKYDGLRLELACRRAIAFQSLTYRTIKSILESGTEQQELPHEDLFHPLSDTYTQGGIFCRRTAQLLQ